MIFKFSDRLYNKYPAPRLDLLARKADEAKGRRFVPQFVTETLRSETIPEDVKLEIAHHFHTYNQTAEQYLLANAAGELLTTAIENAGFPAEYIDPAKSNEIPTLRDYKLVDEITSPSLTKLLRNRNLTKTHLNTLIDKAPNGLTLCLLLKDIPADSKERNGYITRIREALQQELNTLLDTPKNWLFKDAIEQNMNALCYVLKVETGLDDDFPTSYILEAFFPSELSEKLQVHLSNLK